jgi:hypothetical protein
VTQSSESAGEVADAIARAQRGERVAIEALDIAIVPLKDLQALGPSDDETEEGIIELDR